MCLFGGGGGGSCVGCPPGGEGVASRALQGYITCYVQGAEGTPSDGERWALWPSLLSEWGGSGNAALPEFHRGPRPARPCPPGVGALKVGWGLNPFSGQPAGWPAPRCGGN